MNTEFEREFVRLKSISEVYNSKISLTFNNLDIFFSELGDEFRKSEIKVIWNKKNLRFNIFIPERFNFNPVFNKRILILIKNFFSPLIDYARQFPSFEFKLCVGDGLEASKKNSVVFCGNSENNLLIPDIHFIESNGYNNLKHIHRIDYEKKINKLYWRGNLTDLNHKLKQSTDFFKISKRLFYVYSSINNPNLYNMKFSSNRKFFQDHDLSHIFKQLEELKLLSTEPKIKNNEYRFLFDIDGVVNAWSFLEKMAFGSVILKLNSEYNYKQWYYKRLKNYKEFILINEFSDIEEVMNLDTMLLKSISENSYNFFHSFDFENEIKSSFKKIYFFSKNIVT